MELLLGATTLIAVATHCFCFDRQSSRQHSVLHGADQHRARTAFVYVLEVSTTYSNRLASTPTARYKGPNPPTIEAPGHQQVAIVIITPPLSLQCINYCQYGYRNCQYGQQSQSQSQYRKHPCRRSESSTRKFEFTGTPQPRSRSQSCKYRPHAASAIYLA